MTLATNDSADSFDLSSFLTSLTLCYFDSYDIQLFWLFMILISLTIYDFHPIWLFMIRPFMILII